MQPRDLIVELESYISKVGLSYDDSIEYLFESLERDMLNLKIDKALKLNDYRK